MKVLVRGIGNIGTTLANLLLRYREMLGVEVALHKTRVRPFDASALSQLEERGARVYRHEESLKDAMDGSGYVFDCRAAGRPFSERALYESRSDLVGASAQGTEEGFGAPFVSGINDEVIRGQKLVQIASCNTHATSTLLRALTGGNVDAARGDFVVVRRSDDVGAHERLVAATVVARHRDEQHGTHHASDARRLFETVGAEPTITSSDATTPSQLLHTVRFNIRYRSMPSLDVIHRRLRDDAWLSETDIFDSNRLFELGRRYGLQGRLYEHAIVVSNNLLVGEDSVMGWAFVPQEGNTLLSTLDAFLLQTRTARRDEILKTLRDDLLRAHW